MLSFDPKNPIPLHEEGRFTYQDEQRHSAEVDAWLGLRTEEVEAKIQQARALRDPAEQHWVGLPVKALMTPYTELRRLLTQLALANGSKVVDLGAAYGRMGVVIARHFPDIQFTGFEVVPERVHEAIRCFGAAANLFEADLTDPLFELPEADCYFIYDYGSRGAITKTLGDLKAFAAQGPVTVVGRGRLSRDLIEREHPWLSGVEAPRHFAHYSIYRSSSV